MGKLTTFWQRQKERRDCLELRRDFLLQGLDFFDGHYWVLFKKEGQLPYHGQTKGEMRQAKQSLVNMKQKISPQYCHESYWSEVAVLISGLLLERGDWFAHCQTIHRAELFEAAAFYKENASLTYSNGSHFALGLQTQQTVSPLHHTLFFSLVVYFVKDLKSFTFTKSYPRFISVLYSVSGGVLNLFLITESSAKKSNNLLQSN